MAKTRNFADVIRRKLARDSDLSETVEKEQFNADIASQIYEARKTVGLTQKQLAEKIGSHQSVIARLEDADYDSHSLTMLKRIGKALGMRLRVGFYAMTKHKTGDCELLLNTSWTEHTWKMTAAWTPVVETTRKSAKS